MTPEYEIHLQQPGEAQKARVRVRFPASGELRVYSRTNPGWLTATWTDAGVGGIGAELNGVLQVGEIVEIELVPNAGSWAWRAARVVYRLGFHHGFQLLDLGPHGHC